MPVAPARKTCSSLCSLASCEEEVSNTCIRLDGQSLPAATDCATMSKLCGLESSSPTPRSRALSINAVASLTA